MTRSSGCDQHRRGVHGVAIPGSDPHSTTGLQPTVHGITKDRSDHPRGVIRLEAPDSLRAGASPYPRPANSTGVHASTPRSARGHAASIAPRCSHAVGIRALTSACPLNIGGRSNRHRRSDLRACQLAGNDCRAAQIDGCGRAERRAGDSAGPPSHATAPMNPQSARSANRGGVVTLPIVLSTGDGSSAWR